jgi:hypothetical protein
LGRPISSSCEWTETRLREAVQENKTVKCFFVFRR